MAKSRKRNASRVRMGPWHGPPSCFCCGMMHKGLKEVTPMVLTYNEAPNIRRTLEKLSWADEILIVDSFSTDDTLEILKSFPRVRLVQRKFDTFAGQCNFGLQQITSEWVLSMDADYVLSDELNREMAELKPAADMAGYRANFTY